jgi:hypothetical protein
MRGRIDRMMPMRLLDGPWPRTPGRTEDNNNRAYHSYGLRPRGGIMKSMVSRIKLLALAGVIAALGAAGGAQASSSDPDPSGLLSFSTTYSARGSTGCTSTQSITGYEPASSGTYPVFIYTVGTGEDYQSNNALTTIEAMANKGYVAATVNYPNSTFGSCSTLTNRARCIYNGSSTSSAVAKICARSKADCSKGIVVAGLSQGSIMAVLARNYDTRIRAAYGQAIGVKYSVYDLSACVADGNRTLSSTRLRAVTGEEDGFMGSTANSVRDQLRALTGIHGGFYSYSGLNSNGSGWYMVANSEVQDDTAKHCYMFRGGCTGNEDIGWRRNHPWSLDTNLDWLTNFTD